MKVRIRKISEITGFSHVTVSNVLNHKKVVNASTSEQILLADEERGIIRMDGSKKSGLLFSDETD